MKEAGWNFGMGICNAYLGTDLSVYVPVRLDTNWMQYFTFQMVGRVSLPECNTPAVNSICYNVFIYSQFLYFTFRMWDLPDPRIRAKWVHCQWAWQLRSWEKKMVMWIYQKVLEVLAKIGPRCTSKSAAQMTISVHVLLFVWIGWNI